ncbi:hypothetical protein K438DRAFT_1943888 [Mycena galopus ATCC 62051]|nr:hypothetical protein K438DRAFT_1943888 [Mycena galopus ATCC 62051]
MSPALSPVALALSPAPAWPCRLVAHPRLAVSPAHALFFLPRRPGPLHLVAVSPRPVQPCRLCSVPSRCVALSPRTGVPCPFVAPPAILCRPWPENRVALSPTTFVAQLQRTVSPCRPGLPFVARPATPCRPWLVNHVSTRAKSALRRLVPLGHSVTHARSAESSTIAASEARPLCCVARAWYSMSPAHATLCRPRMVQHVACTCYAVLPAHAIPQPRFERPRHLLRARARPLSPFEGPLPPLFKRPHNRSLHPPSHPSRTHRSRVCKPLAYAHSLRPRTPRAPTLAARNPSCTSTPRAPTPAARNLLAHANPLCTPTPRVLSPPAPTLAVHTHARPHPLPSPLVYAHSSPTTLAARTHDRRQHPRWSQLAYAHSPPTHTSRAQPRRARKPLAYARPSPPSHTPTPHVRTPVAPRTPPRSPAPPASRSHDTRTPQTRHPPPAACLAGAATIPHRARCLRCPLWHDHHPLRPHAQLLDIRLSGHDHLRAHAAIACPTPPVEDMTSARCVPSGRSDDYRSPTPPPLPPRHRRHPPRPHALLLDITARMPQLYLRAPAYAPPASWSVYDDRTQGRESCSLPACRPSSRAPSNRSTHHHASSAKILHHHASRVPPHVPARTTSLETPDHTSARHDPGVHCGATPSRTLPPYIFPPRLGRDVLRPSQRAPLSP